MTEPVHTGADAFVGVDHEYRNWTNEGEKPSLSESEAEFLKERGLLRDAEPQALTYGGENEADESEEDETDEDESDESDETETKPNGLINGSAL